MGWLRRWRINRAARSYARKLPKKLKDGWGASQYYTQNQIMDAVKDLGLNGKYVALGYAAFLSEEDFNRLRTEMPIPMTYHEARTAFIEHEPIHLWTAAWSNSRSFFRDGPDPGDGSKKYP